MTYFGTTPASVPESPPHTELMLVLNAGLKEHEAFDQETPQDLGSSLDRCKMQYLYIAISMRSERTQHLERSSIGQLYRL